MPVNSVLTPYPVFFDASGLPLENGFIYIGQPGFEARTTPKASFFDSAATIPSGTASGAAVRTRAGLPVNTSNAPAMIYVDGDFSISVCDRNGVLLYSALNQTLVIDQGGVLGPILAPDGTLGAVGIGFDAEPDTGFVRPALNTLQTAVGGVLVSQQTPAGTVFSQPVSGTGFVSGVAAALDPDLTALATNTGNGLWARTGDGTGAARTITAGTGVTVTNGNGVSGNPTIAVTGWTSLALTSHASGGPYTFNIPATATAVEIFADRVSLDSGGNYFIQIGPSSGVVTTGYESASSHRGGGAGPTTNGMVILSGAANRQMTGRIVFNLMDSATNLWISEHNMGATNTDLAITGGGRVALAGPLERIRWNFTAANNPNNGQIRVRYM